MVNEMSLNLNNQSFTESIFSNSECLLHEIISVLSVSSFVVPSVNYRNKEYLIGMTKEYFDLVDKICNFDPIIENDDDKHDFDCDCADCKITKIK